MAMADFFKVTLLLYTSTQKKSMADFVILNSIYVPEGKTSSHFTLSMGNACLTS